jgi:hypothetical protein
MINVNELRLGNYILFKQLGKGEGKIGQMKPGDFGRAICDYPERSEYHPIPLTPEWLERLGFVYKEPNYTKRPLSVSKNTYRDGTGDYDGFILRFKMEDCIQVLVIKHVHHLQNLYFDLTGEELNIEL